MIPLSRARLVLLRGVRLIRSASNSPRGCKMKSRTLVDVTTISLLVVLAIPVRLASQGQNQQPGHYTVADIGGLVVRSAKLMR